MINKYAHVWMEMNAQRMDNMVVSRQGIKIWRESQGKYLLFLYDWIFYSENVLINAAEIKRNEITVIEHRKSGKLPNSIYKTGITLISKLAMLAQIKIRD